MSKQDSTVIPLTGQAFEEGMIKEAEAHGVNLEAYFAARDLPARPAPMPVQPYNARTASDVIAEAVAPTIQLSVLVGGVVVIGAAVVSVAAAVMAFVSSNAALIGGGALAAAMLWGAIGRRSEEKSAGSVEQAGGGVTINQTVIINSKN